MALSTRSLIILLVASSAVECAKSFKKSEICPCVPLNICPAANRFSKDDAKYFATVLKCTEVGFVRCCPNNESGDNAARRSDDADNIILIDDVPDSSIHAEDLSTESDDESTESTTVGNELTTLEPTTIAEDDSITTTEPIEIETTSEKLIDNSISVIYPNHKYAEAEKRKVMMEHLFLIFPNGEIEAAMATSTSTPSLNNTEKPRRVIVRKRLIKKLSESLEGAESQKSQSVIEPRQIDVDEVKKWMIVMLRDNRRKNDLSTTTESPSEEESTTKKRRRKKIKFRRQRVTSATTSATTSSSVAPPTTEKAQKLETSTMPQKRKIIYDTRSRSNFLRRPSSHSNDDEPAEPEIITTTTTTTAKPTTTDEPRFENFHTTPLSKVLKHKKLIDDEHRAMIETVHKTLSAIHSGVDLKLVEKMLDNHRKKMNEMRKKTEAAGPTKPYRGSARFRKPETAQPVQAHSSNASGTRTRNLSRTRNTATTQTTHKSVVRKAQRTFATQPTENLLLEDVDMLPKQKAPRDFKASPLFGITMDKFNEFDNDMIDKIHETLRPSASVQNGFFPVIQNGTPSTRL